MAVILTLFVLLACLYNVLNPIFESPDEIQHVAFLASVADTLRLPVVGPQDAGPWEQEGTQPPLYYWLAAATAGWVPHPDAYHLAKLNPHSGGIGNPQRVDNKNAVIHDPGEEGWPYRGAALLVRLARFVSTLVALGTLLAIYRLGRIILPDRPGVALAMCALVAFIPQFLFLSASVNNDNLVVLIASWALVVLATWVGSAGRLPRWPQLILLGVLLGLGALSKLSGMLLWPLAGGVILWLAWRNRNWRWLVRATVVVFVAALLLSGWWFVRNLQLYGDLTGLSAHVQTIGPRDVPPTTFAAIMGEFRGFRYSFWALFGWFNILVPEPYYWIADALTLVGLAGLLVMVLGRTRLRRVVRRFASEASKASAVSTTANPGPSAPAHILLLVWLVLVTAGLLRWTLTTPASQGRLLFPALGAIAFMLVVGLGEWLPARVRAPAGLAGLVPWVTWAALCPVLFIAPTYAEPRVYHSLAELGVVPSFLNVRYGDCCDLIGYVPPHKPIHAGDRAPLTLIWRSRQATDRDYSVFVHASLMGGKILGQVDTYPAGGRYPTSRWQPGDIISDTVYIPMAGSARGPERILFNVGLYDSTVRTASGFRELPAFDFYGHRISYVFAGEAALEPTTWPQLHPAIPIDALFGREIQLVGADLSQDTARPGEVVTVTLSWLALANVHDDYTGFVHLLSPAATRDVQDDHSPLGGRYPTNLWSLGTALADPYRLELPADLAPGVYDLWCGLYRPETNDRVQVVHWQTGERWKDDLVHIGTILIRGNQ